MQTPSVGQAEGVRLAAATSTSGVDATEGSAGWSWARSDIHPEHSDDLLVVGELGLDSEGGCPVGGDFEGGEAGLLPQVADDLVVDDEGGVTPARGSVQASPLVALASRGLVSWATLSRSSSALYSWSQGGLSVHPPGISLFLLRSGPEGVRCPSLHAKPAPLARCSVPSPPIRALAVQAPQG